MKGSDNNVHAKRPCGLLQEFFSPGTRIMLDQMNDDPNPVPPGTTGTVKFVDDAGTLHTDFDNGRSLGICPEVDSFHKIEPSEDPAESETPSVTM